MPDGAPHGGMGDASGGAAQGGSSLAWTLPTGWKELPATSLRQGNFSVPGRDKLECYVTVLPGGGGGIAANVNRWRKQMGLGALGDGDAAALPTISLFGEASPFVQVDGTYSGAGGAAPLTGYTMAATVALRGGAAITVKLVGPTEDVRAEVENFKALCASLRDGAPAGGGVETVPEFDGGGLKWTVPEGWKEGPAKSMRLVTFSPADKPGVECYVTILAAQGGGLEANVNRWRGQLSLPPLTAAEIAALPTVRVLGRDARMVEMDGGASGLFGLVCEVEGQTVFVKMTGPIEALRAERERFIAFCKSLS
jgi:hypothetical protein